MDVFRGKKVLLPSGLGPGTIFTLNGKIVRVDDEFITDFSGLDIAEVHDVGDLILMSGLVDSHVHVNEPGRTAWEGFSTATSAACAGGFTTIVDMPLNSIPSTTTMANLKTKIEAARNQVYVDVGFWGGVVPDNHAELKDLVKAGVCGFKCFLIHSGVDEFKSVTRDEAARALEELKDTGSVLLFHAEVEVPQETESLRNPQKYETFLESRPPAMENEAIKMVVGLCRDSGVRCHIVHLGSGEAVPIIAQAKAESLPLSVETCHHYLNLEANSIPDGATEFKCCPPVRGGAHLESLWSAVKSGVIELIVSDHAPCTTKEKLLTLDSQNRGDFMSAWGGIASLQFGLSILWTAAKKRGLSLEDVHRLLSSGPATLAGLQNKKSKIEVGFDADFVIWNPDENFTVSEHLIHHKNKVTPYMGWTLDGVVHKTVLRGKIVYQDGNVLPQPQGKLLINEECFVKSKM